MPTIDYYELIGVDNTADDAAIKAAIRKTRGRFRMQQGSPDLDQSSRANRTIAEIAKAEETFASPEARQRYDQVLKSQPAPAQTPIPSIATSNWVDTAQSYLANGEARNAVSAAKEATRVEPNNIEAWIVRTRASLELGDTQDAEFSASESQRRGPERADVAGLLAAVYDREGRYPDAEKAFARAAQIEPQNPYWQGRVIWAKSDQGRTTQAVEDARLLVKQFAGNEYSRDVLAFILLEDADAALSKDAEGGLYFTNKKQLKFSKTRVDEVAVLGSNDDNVKQALAESMNHLKVGKSRRFVRLSVRRILLFAAWLFIGWTIPTAIVMGVFGDTFGPILALAVNAGILYWFFNRTWRRTWSLNRRALGPYAKTGMQ